MVTISKKQPINPKKEIIDNVETAYLAEFTWIVSRLEEWEQILKFWKDRVATNINTFVANYN